MTVLARKESLSRHFYSRPTTEVARDLLGKLIVHQVDSRELAGRIVEVEAYLGQRDEAAHAFAGVTPRTKVMFGPPGHAYVYLIYGMYHCLNFVTEPDGEACCVLIRALEPVTGIEAMQARRPKARRPQDIASGPGKLTRAMGITLAHYGADLTRGPLTVCEDRDVRPPSKSASARASGSTNPTNASIGRCASS